MDKVLGIFAKVPQPGRVKTRLAAETSPEFAAQVADAFLRDTLCRLGSIDAERWLVLAPALADSALASSAGTAYRLAEQGYGDLGRRLQRFFEARIAAGAERVIVVGADSPTLPPSFVTLAFEQLDHADVVLGPATDGGYYLIGCARHLPSMFAGLDWGSATVLRDTVARLDPGCRLSLLPPWYDVDTLEDWRLLQSHVAALRQSGADPQVPHTEAFFGREPQLT